MPRIAKGSVRWRRGRAYARVTLGEARPAFLLATCTTEEQARQRAELLAELGRRLCTAGHVELAPRLLERAAAVDGRALDDVVTAVERLCAGEALAPRGTAMTFRELGEQWTSGELHRRWPDHVKAKRSAHRDAALLEARVYPILGAVPLAEITLEHAERVMQSLPPMESSTRRQHAQAVARVMTLAAYPVRAIERSPIPKGFVPPQRSTKAKSYLYPVEDRTLLACADVPLGCRMLYGYLAREGNRVSEARAMQWSDLDLERGAVNLDTNKTDDPRAWALNPGVVRALIRWRTLLGDPPSDALVFGEIDFDWHHAATTFRGHLRAAGITRPEIFARTPTRLPLRVHDLRGTFVTVSLANGRTESWVADRTGHRSSVMINAYRRSARHAAELELGELAPLDEAVPELACEGVEEETGREKGPRHLEGEGDASYPIAIVTKSRAGGMAYAGDLKAHELDPSRREPPDRGENSIQDAPVPSSGPASGPFPDASGPFPDASGPFPDASGPFPDGSARTPRGRFLAELSASMVRALDAGDVAAARVAHDAIGQLLASMAASGDAAQVVALRRR